MNVRTITLVFIFQLLIIYCSYAQNQEIKFNLVEPPNIGPLGNITAITQDQYGYMWFSGQQKNCLYKYDGVKMTAFKYDSLNSNSLGGPNLETVYADSRGIIWIGFFGGGMDSYNSITGTFRHYRNDENDSESLSKGMVSAILRDHNGRLWVGTSNGLDELDERTGKFIHYRNEPEDVTSLSCNYVRAIYEDSKGVLWIGTGFEFDDKNLEEGGLNRMEVNGKFRRFMHDPNDPKTLINNKVRCILEDSRSVFWIGTQGDGLHTMDRDKGTFVRHTFNPERPDQLSRPALKHALFDPITFIKEDGSGCIWIGTYSSGINRYDPKTNKVTHYQGSNGFPDKSGWAAYKSRDGVLWLSVGERNPNLYRIDPTYNSIKNIITGSLPRCFYEDDEENLWVSTDEKGMLQYDKMRNLERGYKPADAYDSSSLFKKDIFSILNNNTDTLWLSTPSGIYLYDNTRKNYFPVQSNAENRNVLRSNIFTITEDKKGSKWFSASGVLSQFDNKNDVIKQFLADPKDPGPIHSNQIACVLIDNAGTIWAGAFRGGIYRFKNTNIDFKHYLEGVTINYLFQDSKSYIWVGSEVGLYILNPKTDELSLFFDVQSDIGTEAINKIIEDNYGNLWITTRSQIIKLDTSRTKMFTYGTQYGIRKNSMESFAGMYKTKNGNILIGYENGFYEFNPDEIGVSNKRLTINISDLSINNHKVLTGEKSILQKPIEETDEIKLLYNQNNISFQFAAIDYRSPESNKYYTMLENYDNTWRDATGDKTAFYLNVPPGKYLFHVKAFNIDGTKSEKVINIFISPPWWKTWWAYVIYGLVFLTIIFAIHRFQQQRTIRIERQKAQVKELAQAKEIEKAYHDLRSTQAQLIQSEKMASLGELTAGIAHEIQNPLNFVNNFSEVNNELLLEMKEAIAAGNLDEVKNIANDIIDNEQKINHHGKRADSIVKGMLQHSRVSTGQKVPTDINALADEYLRLAYHGLRAKDKFFNVKLQTEFDPGVGEINIVSQDIGRVLLNLYNNSFYAVTEKAKQQGDGYTPTVSIITKQIRNKVEIRIKDNGIGIPQKVLNKIFQPFFTTKPTGQGTGLGLALSYDIIKSHNGEIKVETIEGEGSEFIIVLPGLSN